MRVRFRGTQQNGAGLGVAISSADIDASLRSYHPLHRSCALPKMADSKAIPDHEIVVVDYKQQDLRRQCYDVRINVFVHEQGFPVDVELDQFVMQIQVA